PTKVLVPPVVIVGLALVAWYATIFHYKPWGWIVTASFDGTRLRVGLSALPVADTPSQDAKGGCQPEGLARRLAVTGDRRAFRCVGCVRLLSRVQPQRDKPDVAKW